MYKHTKRENTFHRETVKNRYFEDMYIRKIRWYDNTKNKKQKKNNKKRIKIIPKKKENEFKSPANN